MHQVVFVDVDDTLIRTVGSKRIPMVRMVDRIKQLAESPVTMYLWSSGGADYAREVAAELGISSCFEGILPKPTLLIDDQHPAEWRYLRHELPNSV